MSGITFLYSEYKKNPTMVEELLSSRIEISENLAGSRFSVQRQADGTFKCFKRNDVVISNIDRTLSKYFEKAIYHFENLPEESTINMQDNWRFGMEYFPNLQPVTISYDRLPLNHLVLTDIQVKDNKGRTLEVISDRETLGEWADQLEIEKPPVYFEGKLTDTQKGKILDFLNTPYDSLLKRFKTESFTSFILKLLNPELSGSFLNNSLDKDIDGLIFRFDGKEAYKIADPDYIHRKTKKEPEKPSDIYNLTVVMLQEYMMSLDFDKIRLSKTSFSERYIEFICKVFNRFVQTQLYRESFEDIDFELPQFLTRRDAELNFEFVKNEKTRRLLRDSNTNQELFKILLASMRSHKKKASGFFTKELIVHHNQLVDKIKDYINGNIKESFFSFEEFKNTFINESEDWDEFGTSLLVEADETTEPVMKYDDKIKGGKGDKTDPVDVDENQLKVGIAVEIEHTDNPVTAEEIAIDHLTEDPEYYTKLILSGIVDEEEAIQLAKDLLGIEPPKNDKEYVEVEDKSEKPMIMSDKLYLEALTKIFKKLSNKTVKCKKSKDVCVMKGKFFPYHNGHETAIADAVDETGAKVFLIVTDELGTIKKEMLDSVMSENPNICGYVFANTRSNKEINNALSNSDKKGLNFAYFSGNNDQCEDVSIQNPDIQCIPSTKHIKVDSVINKILANDIAGYKKLVPKYLYNYFYKIKSELDAVKDV